MKPALPDLGDGTCGRSLIPSWVGCGLVPVPNSVLAPRGELNCSLSRPVVLFPLASIAERCTRGRIAVEHIIASIMQFPSSVAVVVIIHCVPCLDSARVSQVSGRSCRASAASLREDAGFHSYRRWDGPSHPRRLLARPVLCSPLGTLLSKIMRRHKGDKGAGIMTAAGKQTPETPMLSSRVVMVLARWINGI